VALHEALMADPFRPVDTHELDNLADEEAADNYRAVLALRDLLQRAETIEGAYLRLMRGPQMVIPPVFIDQMVHLIVRNMLHDCTNPMQLRAAELFFREQRVSIEDGRLMLADEEIVAMHAANRTSGLGQLLAETGTPIRSAELDVLHEDNKSIYWQRSDRFDTVIDFRFGQPALDAFARVLERWLDHLIKIEAHIEPRPRIDDADWRWHIGLDREATRLMNALYEGHTPALEEMNQIIALFRMRIRDGRIVIDRVKGKPAYLALAFDDKKLVKMKPQNLLFNLPTRTAA
jgi:hypothetical protein